MRIYAHLPLALSCKVEPKMLRALPRGKADRTDRLTCQKHGIGQVYIGRLPACTQDSLRRLGRDITIFTQAIQHRLGSFCSLNPTAHTHNISPGKLRQLILLNSGKQTLTLLDHRICTHERKRCLGMFQEIFADADSIFHCFFADIPEIRNAIADCNMEKPRDSQNSTYIFACPPFNFSQISAEAAFPTEGDQCRCKPREKHSRECCTAS